MRSFKMDAIAENQFIHPLISIVIPVYNAGKFLDQCLFSLKYQTFPSFEVLCVDDGSTDQSVDIIKKYAQLDSRFKLFSQSHQFAGAARNLGIKNAKGEYLLFLDADDYFAPNLLIEAYYHAKLFDAEICVFGASYYDERQSKLGAMPGVCKLTKCKKNAVFSKETNLENIFSFTTPAPWSKLFKRQFVLDKNIYFQNLRNANDLRFSLTALAEANRIVAIDKVFVYYRKNHGTSLQQTKDTDPTCIYEALSGLKTELLNRGLYEQLKKPYYSTVAGNVLYNLRTLRNKQSFESLYKLLKSFLITELALPEISESFVILDNPKDKEEFFDIVRLDIEDYMCKYERFGMRKPIEKVAIPEKKVQSIDNKSKFLNKSLPLHEKVYRYYEANGFWATSRKIFSRLFKF